MSGKKLLTASLMMFMVWKTASAMPAVTIIDQGSFAAGGTVVEAKTTYDPLHPSPDGQTLHGDHAFVSYQIPDNRRIYPLVMLHGAGQFSKTWDTTPDGRDGFRNLFLAKGYPVYLVDQPRRGAAGRSVVSGQIDAVPDEGFWFGQFRMGFWPWFNQGAQFPQDEASLDQFFRQMTPNTAPYDAAVNANALSAVFKRTGNAVLLTHSQGCAVGWLAAMQSDNIKAIAAYEPGSGFVFPVGEVPQAIKNASFFGDFKAQEVPLEDFLKLTKIPIVMYYGDFVPNKPTTHPHNDYWRAASQMADEFAKAVNRHGGNARVIHLPDVGLHGNSHFMFAEKNNVEVANLLSKWLKEQDLDHRIGELNER